MILDSIERLPLYGQMIPGAARIAEAFSAKAPGEAGCVVRKKSYALKADEKRRFEVHFHTIDLMMAAEGMEVIHLCPMDRLAPAEDLADGADGRKMDGAPQGSAVVLEKGYFCAIFPGEAHMVGGMPGGKTGSIEKWVVKVPCTDSFQEEP